MLVWIVLAVLAVYVAQTMLAPSLLYLGVRGERLRRLALALGPRDDVLSGSHYVGRAERALRNMQEALPVFLTLSLLALIYKVGDPSVVQGAGIFLAARIVYVPLYLWGVRGLRSLAWTVGFAGQVIMLLPVVKTIA